MHSGYMVDMTPHMVTIQQREIAQVKLDINLASSCQQTTQNLLPAEHLRNERTNNLHLTRLEGTNDEI